MTDTPSAAPSQPPMSHGEKVRLGREKAKAERERKAMKAAASAQARAAAPQPPAPAVAETVASAPISSNFDFSEAYNPDPDGELAFVDQVLAEHASRGVGQGASKIKFLYQAIAHALEARRIVRSIMAGIDRGDNLPQWNALGLDDNSGRPLAERKNGVAHAAPSPAPAPAAAPADPMAAMAAFMQQFMASQQKQAPAANPTGRPSRDEILRQITGGVPNIPVGGPTPIDQMAGV